MLTWPPVTGSSKTAEEKILIIDAKIAELQSIKELLQTSVDSCLNGCCGEKADENCSLFELE
jgi:hypothetical protein